jgi:hypothetical protein
MKKIITFWLHSLFLLPVATAQLIPNHSFENWTYSGVFEHPVTDPTTFFSNNFELFFEEGLVNVTKVPNGGGFAMRLENIETNSGDTAIGFCSWGEVGDAWRDGVPLPSGNMLTGLTVDLRYSITDPSYGMVGLIPMKNGVPAGAGNVGPDAPGAYVFFLTGDQLTFTSSSFILSPPLDVAPDSCMLVFTSGSPFDGFGIPGDFVEVDNISFIGTSDPVSGGNLDVWAPIEPLLLVDDWTIEDVQRQLVTRSTDAQHGNYSVKMVNEENDWGMNVSRLTMGWMECDQNTCETYPGMELGAMPNSFGFYYKYLAVDDTAFCNLNLMANNNALAFGWTNLFPTTNWSFKSMPIYNFSGQTPDSAYIEFVSGNWQNAQPNSELYIDGLKFHYCDENATINGISSLCAGTVGNNMVFTLMDEWGANGYSWSTTTGFINSPNGGRTITIDNIVSNGVISVEKYYNDGCPSKTFTLNFEFVNAVYGTDVQTSCGSYTWIDGIEYTADNSTAQYTYIGGAVGGCDSIVTLNLTLNSFVTGTDNITSCGSYTWIDGNSYSASNSTATHTIVGGSSQGCDSIVSLNLIVNPIATGTDIQTSCGSFTWINGITYTASNTMATHTIVGGSALNCDSIVTLNLTISNDVQTNDVIFACDEYTWINGTTYTASATANYTISGAIDGICDSIFTLDLTIGEVNTGISVNGNTLTASHTGSGVSYQWIDCDNGNSPIVDATDQSFTATITGNYAVTITDGDCSGTSVCEAVFITGITPNLEEAFSMYPNPTTGVVNFELFEPGQLEIFTINGQKVWYETIPAGTVTRTFGNFSDGVYLIKFSSENNVVLQRLIITK